LAGCAGFSWGVVAAAAGGDHSLGLRSDGTIAAWGSNEAGQCDVPSPNEEFEAIATGYDHCLGLRDDGTLAAWGDNAYGQCSVPSPNSDFVAIAAGHFHSLGARSDGTVVAWGMNTTGQCNVPSPNADFVAVAGGQYHSAGLRSDGTIVAWGNNSYGQCGVPSPNDGFVEVAAGGTHSLAVRVPRVDLIDPDGGEVLAVGGECTIRWHVLHAPPDSIDVALSVDAGASYPHTLAGGLAGTDTSFVWIVDDLPCTTARVRVIAWCDGVLCDYDASQGDFTIESTAGVADVPVVTALLQNRPNPFRGTTSVEYSLAQRAFVEICVYSTAGRLVRTLVSEPGEPGLHRAVWDGRDDAARPVASGVYFVRMLAGNVRQSRRIVYLR